MNVNDVRGRLALESSLQIEVRGRRPLPSPQTSTTGLSYNDENSVDKTVHSFISKIAAEDILY